jgi:hypothetical protein
MGDLSRPQWYKQIKELTAGNGAREPLLIEIKDGENVFYQLNQCDWLDYVEGRQQLEFLMKTYQELGHLFPNFAIQGIQTNSKNLDRKFYYLCKNKIKNEKEIKNTFIETIIRSLIGNTKLLIDYKGSADEKKKTVDIFPLTLTQYRDDLYLMACKGSISEENIRAYKISRIEKIEELKEKFKYPIAVKWDPKEYFKNTSGIVKGPVKKARYKVYGYSKKILSEKCLFDSQIINSTNDFDEYECTYTNIEEFMGLLFIYGQDVEIISDATLKKAFREKADKILKRNA